MLQKNYVLEGSEDENNAKFYNLEVSESRNNIKIIVFEVLEGQNIVKTVVFEVSECKNTPNIDVRRRSAAGDGGAAVSIPNPSGC